MTQTIMPSTVRLTDGKGGVYVMSCMIQKPENTAAIASYIARLLNRDYQFNGMSLPESLGRELGDLSCSDRYGYFDASKIFEALTKLNHAAWLGRYPDNVEERMPQYVPNDISGNVGNILDGYGSHFVVAEWHYKMYKLISFFNYQCDGKSVADTKLYKGMCDFENALARFIVSNSPDYVNQPWE